MKTASSTTSYRFEDIREFLVRRNWFSHGPGRLVSDEEYRAIKDRSLEIPTDRAKYLRAYIEGWMAAKA